MAGDIRILVVDDDDDFRELLRAFLEAENCTVREAANGSAALASLRSRVLPHLNLSDLQMPVMDGWGLHAQLKKDPVLAVIPFAVLSGVASRAPGAALLGATWELRKPIDLEVLLAVLGSVRGAAQPVREVRGRRVASQTDECRKPRSPKGALQATSRKLRVP